MRGYQEIKGLSIRLVYDRKRGEFVYRVEPHPFLVRMSEAEVGSGHKGGNAKAPSDRLPVSEISNGRTERDQRARENLRLIVAFQRNEDQTEILIDNRWARPSKIDTRGDRGGPGGDGYRTGSPTACLSLGEGPRLTQGSKQRRRQPRAPSA